jgi:RNA polymerase sigma-70 factor (ECF subfamily)
MSTGRSRRSGRSSLRGSSLRLPDIGIAEELAQDALVAALERWPEEGIPENPAPWLMTAAKRRAIDSLRRGQMLVQKHEEIARELQGQQQRLGEAMEQALDQVIDDDVLRLIFTACHPVLALEGRVALTLRLIGGLTTAEIARSFLVPEKTMGQRIFRAKKTLSEAHVAFETPRGEELHRRVKSVLCRQRLLPVTCELAQLKRLTGNGSFFSMTL